MSRITPALISAFKRAHDEDLHAPMTIGEEKQLIHAWESLAASKQREAELIAHVERLREALKLTINLLEMIQDGYPSDVLVQGQEALATTPAQSLARLHNEVLEEAAKMCNLGPQWPLSDFEQGCEYMATTLADAIRAMKEPE